MQHIASAVDIASMASYASLLRCRGYLFVIDNAYTTIDLVNLTTGAGTDAMTAADHTYPWQMTSTVTNGTTILYVSESTQCR